MNQTLESLLRHSHILRSTRLDLRTLKTPNTFVNKTHTIPLWFFVFSYCCEKWFLSFSSKTKRQKGFKITIK